MEFQSPDPLQIHIARVWTAVCALLLLSACNLPNDNPPQLATEQARLTQAAATVEALMTITRGSASPAPVRTNQTAQSSPTLDVSNRTLQPSQDCLAQAAFVDDVTIRDGTLMEPGESFVKVWRLRNTGSCAWSPDYSLVFFGGSRLGAPDAAPLSARVGPEQMVDIALEMTAPSEPGTYQGFWKLQTPGGRYFGIGPSSDQSFWVKIEVASPATATGSPAPSATATASVTPSPSATPSGSQTATATPLVEGTATLEVNQSFDLDTGTVVTSNTADLLLEEATAGSVTLRSVQGAQLGEHSPIQDQPDRTDCSLTVLSVTPIPLADLASGDHLCYQTGTGRLGFLRIDDLTPVLQFFYRTFAP